MALFIWRRFASVKEVVRVVPSGNGTVGQEAAAGREGAAGSEFCRVTVLAPRIRLDVAVPSDVPLAGLLPTLLLHSGEQRADDAGPPGGWVLQRVGEGPLDTDHSLRALGVGDGDVLYLRPWQSALPAAVYDDTVDAITTTLRERSRRWTPELSRRAAFATIGVLLTAAALALAAAGGLFGHGAVLFLHASGSVPALRASGTTSSHGRVIAAIAAGLIAIAATLGSGAASRAFGDAGLAAVFGLGALPSAFVSGALALPPSVGGHAAGASAAIAGGIRSPQFLVGSTALLIVAVLTATAAGPAARSLVGAVVAGFVAVAGSVLAVYTSASGAAAAVLSLALVATPVIAPTAYRMVKLPRPDVPASPEELRRRTGPADLGEVPGQAVAADRMIGAMAGAIGAVAIGALGIMLRASGWAPLALATLACVLLLLRARLFSGVVARSWMLGSGLVGLLLLALAAGARWPAGGAAVAAVGLAAVTAIVAGAVRAVRRPTPPLVRMADLAELVATIATVPLALEVLGVFGTVRGLGG